MQIQQSIVTEKILLALCSILRHSFRFIWRFCVSHTFLSILVWLIVAIRHNRTRYGWQRMCTESILLAHHLWLCISSAWATFKTVLVYRFLHTIRSISFLNGAITECSRSLSYPNTYLWGKSVEGFIEVASFPECRVCLW